MSSVAAQHLVDQYNSHRHSEVACLYLADATHTEMATGGSRVGGEAIAQGLRRFLESFPDAHWHALSIIEGDREAVVEYRLEGTLLSRLGPYEAQHQRLVLPGVLWLDLADGAIAHSRDYWDAASFDRQMRVQTIS